jgi:hypothetical protein
MRLLAGAAASHGGAVRFEVRPIPALPRLAWVARVRASSPVVTVLHGPWVETRDDRFVEGAWDAPFALGEFDRSTVLAGSGGRLAPAGVRFATPANMYERLQSVRHGDALYVSNSLALLLAASSNRLDPAYAHYYLDLLAFYRWGIRTKEKRLRLDAGRWAELHDCCNVDVGPDLRITRSEKPWDAPPEDCAAYLSLLDRTVAHVIENASDPRRRWRYRPVAMVSQGYDSTAVAALASRAGCREAVTFLRSNGPDGYMDDSGEQIARELGYEVAAYERNDHAAVRDFRDEEFYLEPWGVDRNMAVMADRLVGALLLSGRSGEVVWTRGTPSQWGLPELQHPIDITPGCALGEFRLRTGFLHFAPATIAAIHARTIHAWNASPAMAPWSVGGAYDKPLARRIAEEAGVPRQLFGQVNKGGPEEIRRERTFGERVRAWLAHVSRVPRRRGPIPRAIGDRLHPRWRQGSFEIQRDITRMIERYERALASDGDFVAKRA